MSGSADLQPVEQLGGRAAIARPIAGRAASAAASAGPAVSRPAIEVGGRVEVVEQREVLVDGLDADGLAPAAGESIVDRLRRRSRSSPASSRCTPLMHLISVDLPAPLSPSIASDLAVVDRRDRPRRARARRRTAWSRRGPRGPGRGGVMTRAACSTRNRSSSRPRTTSDSTASTMTTPMTIELEERLDVEQVHPVADHADHQRADEGVDRRCRGRRGSSRRR